MISFTSEFLPKILYQYEHSVSKKKKRVYTFQLTYLLFLSMATMKQRCSGRWMVTSILLWPFRLQVLFKIIQIPAPFFPLFLLLNKLNNDFFCFVLLSLHEFLTTGTMNQTCHYRGYRDEEGNLSSYYWNLLVVRLAFVVIFEVEL